MFSTKPKGNKYHATYKDKVIAQSDEVVVAFIGTAPNKTNEEDSC